jgi:NAD(P)H-hydrate repair Nnr-like enzyme with NAD(P)H-hydrate dehydratase domain
MYEVIYGNIWSPRLIYGVWGDTYNGIRSAQMAAMMAGVDLCHIFCEKSAGTAIKTYSPELIVHP